MKKGFWVILAMLAIALTAGFVYMYIEEDRQGPVIEFPDNGITYSEGEDQTKLLEGVTATDDVEGDVTASLKIEKVLFENEDENVTVIYIAKDSKNNITKVTREVAKGEELITEEPEEKEEESVEEKEEQKEEPEKSSGEAKNEAAIAKLDPGAPRFYLTAYEVTLAIGSEFYAMEYVDVIEDDVDSFDDLSTRIQLSGEVDTSKAGTYELTYYVFDSERNQSNTAVLTVTVE